LTSLLHTEHVSYPDKWDFAERLTASFFAKCGSCKLFSFAFS